MGEKISDLEDQVNHKVKAIQEAEDTIQQLKVFMNKMSDLI